MANMEELYAALQAADAAGNTEDAKQIANYIRQVGVPEEQPKKATTLGGNLKELVKGVVPGALGLLETAGAGASALLPEEYETPTRKFLKEAAAAGSKPFEAAPGYEQSIGRKLGEGVGSTVPFFAAAPLGAAGVLGAGALGVAAGAGEARMNAEQKGATPEQRRTATQLGAPTGLLDVIAPEIGPLKSLITTALARGGVEGATEAAQKVAQNLIAKGVYDPKQDVLAGSGEEGVYGAGIGALTSLVVDLALGRKSHGAASKPAPLSVPEQAPEQVTEQPAPQAPLAIGMDQPFTPVALPDGSVAMTKEDLDAYHQNQFEEKYRPQKAEEVAPGIESMTPAGMSDVREMAGFSGIPSANIGMMELARSNREAEAKQEAKARQAQIKEVMNTPFNADPLQDSLMRQKALEQLGVEPQQAKTSVATKTEPQVQEAPEFVEAKPAKLTKEQQKPIFSEEEKADVKDARSALKDVNAQITKAKSEGTDLFTRLKGEIHPDDVNDIAPEEKKGRVGTLASKTAGKPLSSLVADGSLNEFLPPDLRITAPGQDETAGVEYIKEAIRTGDTKSFDSKNALTALEQQKEQLKSRIEQPVAEREANLELGQAAEEQAGFEGLPTDQLVAHAQQNGIDTDQIVQDVANRTGHMTADQYHGAVRDALISEINSQAGMETLASAEKAGEGSSATKEELQMQKDLEGKTLIQAAQYAIDKAPDKFRKFVATKILNVLKAMEAAGVKFVFNVHGGNQRSSDLYNAKGLATFIYGQQGNPTSVVVLLNGAPNLSNQLGFPSGMNYTTLLHELLHVATRMKVNFLAKDSVEVKRLFNLYDTVIREFNKQARNGTLPPVLEKYHKRINNALSNPDEMMTWGITDTEMQKWLNEIKVGEKTLMDKLVELVREVLGIAKPFETALDRLVKTTDSILDIDIKTLEKGMKSYKYSLGPAKKNSKAPPQQQSLFSKRAQELFGQKSSNNISNKAPSWVPEKIWKLHELVRRADAEASGFIDLRENSQGRVPSTGALKRNQTMSFRRLNKAIEDYVGNDWSAVNDLMVRMNEESNRRDEEISKNIETFKSRSGKIQHNPTKQGQESIDLLASVGRVVEPPAPGYFENLNKNLKDINANKKNAYEHFKTLGERKVAEMETKVFSSDAGIQAAYRKYVNALTVSDKAKIGMLINFKTSQASHHDAVAGVALEMGMVRYDKENGKWKGENVKDNFVALSKKLQEMKQKNNFSQEQLDLIYHTALEAKQVAQMVKENESLAADKKKIISPEQMKMMKPGLELFKLHPELNDAVDIWNGIRKHMVAVAQEGGMYSKEDAEFLLDNADYVPMYREMDPDVDGGPVTTMRGLMAEKDKGRKGSLRPVNDIFDNQIRWAEHLVSRSVKAHQARTMMDEAVKAELGEQFNPEVTPASKMKNVVKIWRNGKEESYSMDDPLFMDAFAGLQSVSIPMFKVAAKFANVLRQSIVMYPLFSVSQVFQDSTAAIFSSGLKPQFALKIPVLAVKELVQTMRNKSANHAILKEYGAVGVRDVNATVVRMDAEAKFGMKGSPSFKSKVMEQLNSFAMAADNSVRQAVYQASLDAGLSQTEALEKSFEIFNVRRRGTSKTLALAGQVIPFFPAYLAAQHVAYNVLTGRGTSPTQRAEAHKVLAQTTASVMVLSMLYAMMNGDDDDYLKKPAAQRDRLLMIPGTNGMSIPLRADVFLFPKIIAEHTYLMLTDKGYEDGRKFRDSMTSALSSALSSPTVVPQIVKPLAEVAINYDFFQQRPLIGTYQKGLEIDRQFTEGTSEFSKMIGQTGLMSPINADHLIRGMFGSFGGLSLYMTNALLSGANPSGERASMSLQDAIATLPGTSGFVSKSYESALKKDFYTLKEEVDRANNTMNDLKKNAPQEIEGFVSKDENIARLGLAKSVNAIGSNLSKIRGSIKQISNSDMSADKKQELIEGLRQSEEQLLKGVDVKKLRELGKI